MIWFSLSTQYSVLSTFLSSNLLKDVRQLEQERERGDADYCRGDARGGECQAAHLAASLLARGEQFGDGDEDGKARVVARVLDRLDREQARDFEGGGEDETDA